MSASEEQKAQATELKNQGNKAFAAKDYSKADDLFTQAIAIDPSNHVFFSNRCAVRLTMKRFEEAEKDAQQTIELKSDWPKGYLRLGSVYEAVNDLEKAHGAFSKGLKVAPNDPSLQAGLQRVMDRSRASGMMGITQMFNDAALMAKLASNPQYAALMAQPDVQAMLADLKVNPNNMQKYSQSPAFLQLLQALLSEKMGVNMADMMKGDAAQGAKGAPETNQPAPVSSKESEDAGVAPMDTSTTEEESAPSKATPSKAPTEVSEDAARKKDALDEKEKGNEAYKTRKFDQALGHYSKALELDPENIVFYLNKASVYMAQKDYAAVVKECDQAIAKGREIYADFALIAKAYHRKGRALMRLRNFDGALESFDKSMMEKRTAECLKDQQLCERYKKKAEEEAYFDEEKSGEAKKLGNEAFSKGLFPEAVKHFTEAIKRNPKNHALYSNRAAAYTKLGAYNEATKDCDQCIKLNPKFLKGYTRKATIYLRTQEHHKAMSMYEKAQAIDPENKEVQAGIQEVHRAIATKRMQGGSSEEEQKRALADPEIQAILRDPKVGELMRAMQSSPGAAQRMINENADLRNKYSKLVAAGIM